MHVCMNNWINDWMVAWKILNAWMEELIILWMLQCMNAGQGWIMHEWLHEKKIKNDSNECMNNWMCMNAWMITRMNEWIDVRMNNLMHEWMLEWRYE